MLTVLLIYAIVFIAIAFLFLHFGSDFDEAMVAGILWPITIAAFLFLLIFISVPMVIYETYKEHKEDKIHIEGDKD